MPGPASSASATHLAKAARRGTSPSTPRLGRAWLALSAALALHVTDEALTGFLSVYNPTVIALRARFPWWPMPTFEFRAWLAGLIVGVCVLFAVAPLFFRGGRPLRPPAWVLAALMVGNGVAHTVGTIAGRTVSSVRYPRPMPGFYSSPFLIAAALWTLVELKRSRPSISGHAA